MKKLVGLFSVLLFTTSIVSAEEEFFFPVLDTPEHKAKEVIFHNVLKKIKTVYDPIFEKAGFTLTIEKDWEYDEANAKARATSQTDRVLEMWGGLLRKPEMTEDAFMAVACHEIGHHLGEGVHFPEYYADYYFFVGWAEGEADYFTTSKCLRKMWNDEDNIEKIKTLEIPAKDKELCKASFKSEKEQALCLRSLSALKTMTDHFDHNVVAVPYLKDKKREDYKFRLGASFNHPDNDCRLETAYAGALCPVDSETQKCLFTNQLQAFSRPLCWYGIGGILTLEYPTLSEKRKAEVLEEIKNLNIKSYFYDGYEDDEILDQEKELKEQFPFLNL